MRNSAGFTIAKHEINFNQYGDTISIIPISDIHKFSHLHHEKKFKEWCDWARVQENAYFLGVGDYIDIGSDSERVILNDPRLHDSTINTLDALYRRQAQILYEELSFMKGKIIGLLDGNHRAMLSSGISSTQVLCELFGCKYLGICSFIKLVLKYRTSGTTHAIDIFAHHGLSGGRTVGASINKVENMLKGFHADIYLQAHDHKRHIAMQSRLELSDGRNNLYLVNKKIVMARTGGFLMGYVEGETSYVANSAYNPVDIGTITITLTPKRTYQGRVDRRWIELNASL